MRKNIRSSNSGTVIMLCMFFLGLIAFLSTAIFLTTTANMRMTANSLTRASAVAYADGVLENLFEQWRQAMIADSTTRATGMPTQTLAGILTSTTTALPTPTGMTLTTATVQAADPFLVKMSSNTASPTPESGSAVSTRQRLNYLATVTVTYKTLRTDGVVTLQRSFVRGGRNLFDNYLFSTRPTTEINPGADMYIDKAYIGGDLYTAHNTLHFMSDVTYTGTHYLDYSPNDARKACRLHRRLRSTWIPLARPALQLIPC